MQKCESCNIQFTWSNIYRAFWGWMYRPVECDQCGTEHRITIPGRFTLVSLTIIPMLIFLYFLSPFNNSYLTLGVGIVILFTGSLLAPYIVRFTVDP